MSPDSETPTVFERSLDGPVDLVRLLRLGGSAAPRFYLAPFDDAPAVAAIGSVATVGAVDAAAAAQAMRAIDPSRSATWVGGFAFDPAGRARRATDAGDPWHAFPPALWVLPEACLLHDPVEGSVRLIVAGHTDRNALRERADRIVRHLEGGAARLEATAPVAASALIDAGAGSAAELVAEDPAVGVALERALETRLERAIAAVRRGDAAKVVLAAARSRSIAQDIDPLLLLEELRTGAPHCTVFLVEPAAGRVLLGATPERLLRLSARGVRTMALAGSAARGATDAEDQARGASLLASEKDQEEHQLVVASIVEALGEAGVAVAPTPPPRLRRLARIQHLETPISGHWQAGGDVLDLASRLHPTPALGGEPPAAALALIRALEPEDRGWYGGAVGWRDGRGDGDLAVVIRALRLAGRTVTAFAGAGLVAASEPSRERDEIALKLQAAFDPLSAALQRAANRGRPA